MNNIERFKEYLQAYSRKDLDKVLNMFAPDIHLRDWKISVKGLELAKSETEKNFQNARSIEIDLLEVFQSEDVVAGELKITVDKTEVLYVVDVLKFNNQQKISSIHAYLGRSD